MTEISDPYSAFSEPELHASGLNMQGVLRVRALPLNLQIALDSAGLDQSVHPALIVFGNGGKAFWEACRNASVAGPDPVDQFSRTLVAEFMQRRMAGTDYRFLYPGSAGVPLQMLGELLGWHHPSPMKVGINDRWGLWYAYRAVIAVAADLPVSAPVVSENPCTGCRDKPCISACPAQALEQAELRLNRCIGFRVTQDSRCSNQCLARLACPVAPQHRYTEEQLHYHYGKSLEHILAWRAGTTG